MNAPRALAEPRSVKLTVRDYHLLAEAGALDDSSKTELIDGAIVAVSPEHTRHGYAKFELAHRLRLALEALGSALNVYVETSVGMPPHDEPRLDITLSSDGLGDDVISLNSVALAVEVAVTTLEFDRTCKAAVYAGHGVPEYSLLYVRGRVMHRMW